MEFLSLLPYGTPVVLVGMLVYMARIDERVRTLQREYADARIEQAQKSEKVRYADTCITTHIEVDRRLDRLERCANGMLK